MNSVALAGRLVADPELKYTPSGVAVCSFRIAVDRRMKSETGEKQADFINVVAWRQSAEFVANYLTKGSLVGVEGSIQSRSWVQQDGQKRYATEVVAYRVEGLGGRPRDQQPPDTAAGPAQEESSDQPGPADLESDMDYDPFAEE